MANLIPAKGSDFVENLFNSQFLISVITKIEVLGYNDLPRKMSAMSNFVSLSEILPVNETVTEKTIELKRSRKMKLGDAIIAASAIVNNLVLITRNVDDFKFIPSLTVLNPHEI